MPTKMHRKDVEQFIRYVMVGVLNTLITLAVIFLCKSVLDVNQWVSNAIGYVAGMVNSFLWNKVWVFRSRSRHYRAEAVKFMVGFLLCYGLQLLATWLMTSAFGDMEIILPGIMTVSGYGVATLLGMVLYTVANFVFNRAVTFK